MAADDSFLGGSRGVIFCVVELSWQKDRVGKRRFNADRKSKAKFYIEKKTGVTFADVAGIDEAEEEVAEVVGFLKDPDKYQRLGGHIPKGVLIVGPPGTGNSPSSRRCR